MLSIATHDQIEQPKSYQSAELPYPLVYKTPFFVPNLSVESGGASYGYDITIISIQPDTIKPRPNLGCILHLSASYTRVNVALTAGVGGGSARGVVATVGEDGGAGGAGCEAARRLERSGGAQRALVVDARTGAGGATCRAETSGVTPSGLQNRVGLFFLGSCPKGCFDAIVCLFVSMEFASWSQTQRWRKGRTLNEGAMTPAILPPPPAPFHCLFFKDQVAPSRAPRLTPDSPLGGGVRGAGVGGVGWGERGGAGWGGAGRGGAGRGSTHRRRWPRWRP